MIGKNVDINLISKFLKEYNYWRDRKKAGNKRSTVLPKNLPKVCKTIVEEAH